MLAPSFASLVAAILVAVAPSNDAGERWMFGGHSTGHSGLVQFEPRGLRPNAVRGGWVQTGRRTRPLTRLRLVRGLSHGGVRVKLGKGWLRKKHRVRPWLVVKTRPFGEFDGYSVEGGSLRRNWDRAYSGQASIEAVFDESGGGFARVWRDVHWDTGAEVFYRMALLVPSTAGWCYWNPVRWDNYSSFGSDGEVGGIRIENGALSLIRARYGGEDEALTAPVAAPRNRWFTLEVRQRLSDGPDATNEVLIDGQPVAASVRANTYGRSVDTVRFGAVDLAGSCSGPGSVLFDDVSIGTR